MKFIDIACNTFFMIVVNLIAMDIMVLFATLIGVGSFIVVNTLYVDDESKNRVHVLAVQIPLFFALCLSGL